MIILILMAIYRQASDYIKATMHVGSKIVVSRQQSTVFISICDYKCVMLGLIFLKYDALTNKIM